MYTLIVKDDTGQEVLNKNCHIISAFWMEEEQVGKHTFEDADCTLGDKLQAILGLDTLLCEEAAAYSKTLLNVFESISEKDT